MTWVSAAVITQASSHQLLVGVSAAVEAELLGRSGDLPDVADVRRAIARGLATRLPCRTDGIAQAQIAPGIAVGRQEPVRVTGNVRVSS